MEFVDILSVSNELYMREFEQKGKSTHADVGQITRSLLDIKSFLIQFEIEEDSIVNPERYNLWEYFGNDLLHNSSDNFRFTLPFLARNEENQRVWK